MKPLVAILAPRSSPKWVNVSLRAWEVAGPAQDAASPLT